MTPSVRVEIAWMVATGRQADLKRLHALDLEGGQRPTTPGLRGVAYSFEALGWRGVRTTGNFRRLQLRSRIG